MRLARPVRGVHVRSSKTAGNCAPDFGDAVIDFEPLPEGQPSVVECDCAPDSSEDPDLWQHCIAALAAGALSELAAGPIAARVVIRAITFHPVDSCGQIFTGLGALASCHVLSSVAQHH